MAWALLNKEAVQGPPLWGHPGGLWGHLEGDFLISQEWLQTDRE